MLTPAWRPDFTPDEIVRVRLTEAATQGMARILAHPASMDVRTVRANLPNWSLVSFPDEHFAHIQSYSRWLLSPDFYRHFSGLEFVAIVQLDAVLLRPLPSWVWDWDYTGAPWNPPWRLFVAGGRLRLLRIAGRQVGRRLIVGNGGLSIRRISAFDDAAQRLPEVAPPLVRNESNEDAVWAYYARRLRLRLAPAELARSAFLDLRQDDALSGLPGLIGVHGIKPEMPQAASAIRAFARGVPPTGE